MRFRCHYIQNDGTTGETMATVHDLAADWEWMETHSGFRMRPHGVVWEEAEYMDDGRIRVGRLSTASGAIVPVYRYPDPAVVVVLV